MNGLRAMQSAIQRFLSLDASGGIVLVAAAVLATMLKENLHPWVAYALLPLFAFTNAGVDLEGVRLSGLTATLPVGTAAGLFLGKQMGVSLVRSAAAANAATR